MSVQLVCVNKYRDCTGSVKKYDMYREDKDEYVTLEADRLKALIKHGKVTVVNLKLTANNALLPIKKKGVPKANDIWPPAR